MSRTNAATILLNKHVRHDVCALCQALSAPGTTTAHSKKIISMRSIANEIGTAPPWS